MQDIAFDIATREIIMTKGNADFAQTSNPSVQNGGIFQYGKGFNPLAPMDGIGFFPDVMGGGEIEITYQMNRWMGQVKTDGATLAKWAATMVNNNATVTTQISYL